jgi:hypothetical protein
MDNRRLFIEMKSGVGVIEQFIEEMRPITGKDVAQVES